MKKLLGLYKKCKKSGCCVLIVLIRHLYFQLKGKTITAHQKVKIKGLSNITTHGKLRIGMEYVGFMYKSDKTLLNIKGKAVFHGDYSIGRGCRIDIDEKAFLEVGKTGYLNVNSNFIIRHGLKIGDDCAISWGCQFLDDDFHHIKYENQKERDPKIVIGNHVWIGSNVSIYKGTRIPDGCVVAADSSVRGVFTEKDSLIAGNPARVIKSNVSWK